MLHTDDTRYYDASETLDPTERERSLFEGLGERLVAAVDVCPGLARHLDGHDAAALKAITSREALSTLPVLTKEALIEAQTAMPPLGGFARPGALDGCRLFMSPGPVFEPQLPGVDPWGIARALHAAGLRAGDVVHNSFGYQQTPGGLMLDTGARALGCAVYPAGVGGTDGQVAALAASGAIAYTGTPDYLKTLLEAASEAGVTHHLKRALVSGGALFPAMRAAYKDAGVDVMQCYATADLGLISYETSVDGEVVEGMMVAEHIIVEILRPGSNVAVAPGEVGEIVVTRLHPDYPLLRFATGDLSRQLDGPSPCGRTGQRLAGWLGRADQRTKVRGQFVDPRQIQRVRDAHPSIQGLRALIERVDDKDALVLEVVAPGADDAARAAIGESLRAETSLGGDVRLVDDIPNDGVVVRDMRDYS